MNSKEVEDFFPLSPMQQGMMFHSLLSPDSGVYVEQVSCIINNSPDINAFKAAWLQLIEDYAVLRTSFMSKGLKEPLQVIYRKVEVPFELLDWRHLTENEREIEYDNYCLSEKMKGFNLSKAPLLRFILAQAGKDSFYFIWTYHHILLDGWSMPLLFREVLQRYAALSNGRQYSFKPVKTFRDYIVWLKKQNMQDAGEYWQKALKGLCSPTIISQRINRNGETEKILEKTLSLPKEIMKELQSFAVKNQLTMNTIVQGAWVILLSTYVRQKDLVYGTTVSGRPIDLPGAEEIIGLLINTLPVRIKLSPEEKLPEWLMKLQIQQLEMRQFEYTPLTEIHKYTDIPNSQPLFDSLVVFENYPMDALEDGGIKGIQISSMKYAEKTNFPLALIVGQGDTLEFRLIYDSGSIEPVIAGNMLENLKTVIASFVRPETSRLSDIEIINEDEKLSILKNSKNYDEDLSEKHCLHKLFELQVEKTPSKTAVVFMEQELTYMQLNKKANQFANYLIRQGVKRESLVGVLVSRSAEMIIAILGILKAGAAYVPIDPNIPAERIKLILKDSGLENLVTQSKFEHQSIFMGLHVVFIDMDRENIASESAADPAAGSTPDNLAYVIYTSGSTGKPKGVLINHSGASNFVKGFSLPPAMNSNERGLQFFSLSFDGSVADIFPVLTTGATLFIPESETLLDIRKTERFICDNSITSIVITPSVLSMMNESKIPGLKTIITGGEKCGKDLALKYSSGRKFFNAYGPTEASVGVTMFDMDDFSEDWPSVPIGSALINSKLYVLDEDYKIIPIGCIGELYIGGYGLSRGYLNMPTLTAESFIPNPYADSPGERIYKTGDLVRLLPGGNLEYIDRIDQQVKIRGFRIELGEIESFIRKCPGVQDVSVQLREDASDGKTLAAYIIPEEEAKFSLPELKKSCTGFLPNYMIPSKFVLLKEFPLTRNGKIDKKALPEPEKVIADNDQMYMAPRDAWEHKLIQIWEEILKVHPVGVKDNFFDLGGHSLMAVRLMDLIYEKFNKNIPLTAIYQNPTIESLAGLMRDEVEIKNSSLLVELKKSGEMAPLFFVHPSGGSVHWYSDLAKSIEPDTPFYGIQALGIDGRDKLDDSIEVMASRYIGNILQKQPGGTYYIGGWSFGVIVAFEVACQLLALGHKVGLLALLDCGPFMPYEEPKDSAELLAGIFSKYTQLDVDFLRTLNEDERIKFVFQMAKKNKIIPFYIRLTKFSFYIHILKTMQQAWRKYKIKTYPGKITLFRSGESKSDPSLRPDMGWGQFTSQPVSIIDIPGTHISMMQQPEADILAKELNTLIRKNRDSHVNRYEKSSNALK